MKNNSKFHSLVLSFSYSPQGNKLLKILGGPRFYANYLVWKRKKMLLASAKKEYENGSQFGNLYDYKRALEKHWVSYQEYSKMYQFFKKSEEERNEYVALLRMSYFYRRYNNGVVLPIMRDKQRFLKAYSKYIHRKWLFVPDASYDEFEQLVTSYDCIIKPCDAARGKGVFKIYKDADHSNDKSLFETCVKNRMMVEQCIESCKELMDFHPQSLNTIRVVTIAGKERACVFSGVLRTGVGDNVVDNTHAGGISVQINPQSGVIETDGADSNGNKYVYHPDSKIQFKGFRIPHWDDIVEKSCKLAIEVANPITGWDVVVNSQGEVEFIEANYGPDLDVMQVRCGHGIKKKLYALIKEYCGIEMK